VKEKKFDKKGKDYRGTERSRGSGHTDLNFTRGETSARKEGKGWWPLLTGKGLKKRPCKRVKADVMCRD